MRREERRSECEDKKELLQKLHEYNEEYYRKYREHEFYEFTTWVNEDE